MDQPNNNINPNNQNFNHFSSNVNNFEQYLQSNNMSHERNNGNNNNNANDDDRTQNRLNDRIGVNIPRELRGEFDEVAASQLGRGTKSTKELVIYLNQHKRVLTGGVKEVAYIDLAEIASGLVKQVVIKQTSAKVQPQMAGITTVLGMRQFCIQHPLLVQQLPYRQPLNTELNVRTKTYTTYCLGFQVSLISALADDEFMAHLTKANDNTVDAVVRPPKQKVGQWYTHKEELHVESTSAKSAKVSKSLGNSLDILRLMDSDPAFRSMFLNNQVNGVDAYVRNLKQKRRQEVGGFTTVSGQSQAHLNNDIIQSAQNQVLEDLKNKEKILTQMMSKDEKVKSKLVLYLVGLGIRDVTDWKFDNLNAQNYNLILNGVKKAVDMIEHFSKNEKCKFIMKKILANQVRNFFIGR